VSVNGIVAFETVNGNTRQGAWAIPGQLRSEGSKAAFLEVKEHVPKDLNRDVLFIDPPLPVEGI
jgi:hypothetical protein